MIARAISMAILVVSVFGAFSPRVAAAQEVVTPDSFIRAETDRMFQDLARQAGRVNRLFHFRNVTPLERQTMAAGPGWRCRS